MQATLTETPRYLRSWQCNENHPNPCKNPIAFRVEYWPQGCSGKDTKIADVLSHKDSPLTAIDILRDHVEGAVVRQVDRVGTPF